MMDTIRSIKREIETEEFYETVRNIMENEYLTNREKEVVNKLVNHYKLKMASMPLYTTDSIENIKDVLNNLYNSLLAVQRGDRQEDVDSIENDIAQFEEQLNREYEELYRHLNDF